MSEPVKAQPAEEDTQYGKYLTFRIDKEIYGLEIKYVTEIIGIQPITFVPRVPAYVKGIINLRGKVIPVIDMRLRFKKEETPYTERTCIIVIDIDAISLGMIVDQVDAVLDIPDDKIVPPPELKTDTRSGFVKSIGNMGNEVILILDSEKINRDQ